MRIPIVFPIFLLFVAACSSTQPPTSFVPPQLLYVHPLPAYPQTLQTGSLRIPVEIYVTKEGTVGEVQWHFSSGSTAWDSAAIVAIRSWKYYPAQSEGMPINIRIQQTVVVTFTEPRTMMLGEIACMSKESADSVCTALRSGMAFDDVRKRFDCDSTRSDGGKLGKVSLQIFPAAMKSEIQKLHTGECTPPLRYGATYVIYLRLPE